MNDLQNSVGQLAKTSFPTLNPLILNGFSVGRQHQDSSRTSAHIYTRIEATTEQPLEKQGIIYLNSLIEKVLTDVKVCYHDISLIQQIEEFYTEEESQLFIQFIRTFAMLRRGEKPQEIRGVILTDNDDFLSALKLMQQRKVEDYSDLNIKTKEKLENHLYKRFTCRTFSTKILAKELRYNYNLLGRILTVLQLEQKIEFFEMAYGHTMFRLRTKKVNYV